MKPISFGHQIVASFGAIAIVFIIASYLVYSNTKDLTSNIERVDELHLPTAQASKNLSNGISRSLAALRGWLILKDPQFKTERDEAWRLHIQPALTQLNKLSKNWKNSQNIARLEAIEQELMLFKSSQEDITKIAHTLESTPATEILIESAKPIADVILHNITEMIELSAQQPMSTEEQTLFKNMADFRGTFAQSLASIRLFLISADTSARLSFEAHWRANENSFSQMLMNKHLMSPKQNSLFSNIESKRARFYVYPKRMFSIRLSDGHNKAFQLLRTQAAPSAKLILTILDEMVVSQRNLLDAEISLQEKGLHNLNEKVMYSILIGLILTMVLGTFITKSFKTLNRDIDTKANALSVNVTTNKGILDTSKDSIVSITTKGEILSCNKTTSLMFGYRKDELIGNNIRMLMPEPYSRQHDDYLAEHMRTRIKKDIWGGARELTAKKKDGSTLPIFLSIGSVTTEKGLIFTGYIRDITEQKTAQDKLQSANKELTLKNSTQKQIARINEVMHGASDMSILGNNIIVSLAKLVNACSGVLYRYDTDTDTDAGEDNVKDNGTLSIVSTYAFNEGAKPPISLQIGEGLVGQCAKIKTLIHTKNIPPDYIKIKSGLGEGHPKELLIFPILFEHKLLGVVELATFSHISEEQKQIIEAVRGDIGIVINNIISIEKTNLLLARMKQQSVELQEQSKKLARSNAYKSDFLAAMSHEIRTPMNGVLGMLGMLLKSKLSNSQLKQASMARSSAQSLLTIINDILDFSKVEAGKLELEMLDFDLPSLLEEICELMAVKAHEKGININLDIADVFYSRLKGDSSRIRQILVNLIGNALKFTHQGHITIRASLKELGSRDLELTCEISDTGIGIEQDKLSGLFEAFNQADASTTREYGGTGLGLTICKKLCLLMHGDISVKSEIGKGSQFKFSVILEKSVGALMVTAPLMDESFRVLVIDHQANNRDIMVRQIESWGGTARGLPEIKEALALIKSSRATDYYVYVFLDIDAIRDDVPGNLKHLDDITSAQVVLMFSWQDDQIIHPYLNSGKYKCLRKPVLPSLLKSTLSSLTSANDCNNPTQTGEHSLEKGHSPIHFHDRESTPRILLVEDNFFNQETMKFMLDDLGIIPDVASDGNEAIEILNAANEKEYSLVLMDCQMPIMDGYTATKHIRSGKGCKKLESIPIIALTANAMSSDRDRCLAAGMDDYLSKPIDPLLFSDMLHKWIR